MIGKAQKPDDSGIDPDEVLRRMLNTPPDPKVAKPKGKPKPKKKPAK